MKKKHVISLMALICAFSLIRIRTVQSETAFPPPGNDGDPVTDSTCHQFNCHPGPTHSSNPDTLTLLIDTGSTFSNQITLNNSFQYLPHTTYYILFQLHSTTGVYGFQMDCLDQTSNHNQAGSFTIVDTIHTVIATSHPLGTRQYMCHHNADGFKNWVFQWTAPDYATGPVTFYYAYNTSDTAFLDSIAVPGQDPIGIPGGVIYTGTVTSIPSTLGINILQDEVSGLNLFPNPANNELNVSFNMKETGVVSLNVYTVDGSIAEKLMENQNIIAGSFNRIIDLSAYAPGIYLLRFSTGQSSITRKIVKL